jgi:hypothetical protein
LSFTKKKPNKNIPTIFLTLKNDKINIQDKVNIVLSPSFYWFKKEALPVKNSAQAKKIIPSLFDTSIPEGHYSYSAIKKEDNFWIFAYDDALITRVLLEAGIKPSQIKDIYFAQTEIALSNKALRVNDTYALISSDECISMAPLAYTQTDNDLESYFKTHVFSKNSVAVSLFQNSVIDEKYLYRLMTLAIVFIVIYLGNYIVLRQDYKEERLKQYVLEEKYQLPTTSFERKSLKKSLESKEKRQLLMREKLKSLLMLPLQKGEHLKKISISEKKLTLEIVMNKAKRAEILKKEIQKILNISSAKVVDKTFYIGGKL